MPATWLATLKAVLPYIDSIVSVVTPAFTRRKVDSISNQAELLQRQVDELQQAASSNTENIRHLAEQLKAVVVALDQAAVNLEAANRRHSALCVLAIVLSAAALGAAIIVAVLR